MRIVELHAENVKRLRVVTITPQGNVVQITGENGAGKSSVLDCIYWALAGTKDIPSQPIRKGALKAVIKLNLGEVVVTRKFTASGTTLTVESKDGAKFQSPQSMLDELMGSMSFDPLAFTRLEAKAQLEELRKLVSLDVDIDALDAANKADYDKRSMLNRDIKNIQGRLSAMPDYSDVPAKPVDISALLTEIEGAAKHNSAVEDAKRDRAKQFKDIGDMRNTATDKHEKAEFLRNQAKDLMAVAHKEDNTATDLEVTASDLEMALMDGEALPEPVDVSAVKQRIEEARTINARIGDAKVRRRTETELSLAKTNADTLTSAMEQRNDRKHEAIAAAKMPVKGLSFGDGEVVFNNLPLNQASDAEQLRVSIAIAMAANPKLRVLRIRDGSLLDKKSLALLAGMAETQDYQVWIEVVSDSGNVGIVMEDGMVKGTKDGELFQAEKE